MAKSLSQWVSIAEIAAAASIVISLIFVGLQIREGTKATQAATQQQGLGYELEILFRQTELSDEEVILLGEMTQGLDFTDVPRPELNARSIYIAALRLWEDLYLQHQAGTLSDAAWESRKPMMHGYANGPAINELLEAGFLLEEFADYLRSLQTEPDP